MKNELFSEILKNEGLKGWTYKFDTGGGLCLHSRKEIWLGKDNNLSLFLHEVAHALVDKKEFASWYRDDPTGHFAIWGDKFTTLVSKYMKAK